jgi:hypothetical protein
MLINKYALWTPQRNEIKNNEKSGVPNKARKKEKNHQERGVFTKFISTVHEQRHVIIIFTSSASSLLTIHEKGCDYSSLTLPISVAVFPAAEMSFSTGQDMHFEIWFVIAFLGLSNMSLHLQAGHDKELSDTTSQAGHDKGPLNTTSQAGHDK